MVDQRLGCEGRHVFPAWSEGHKDRRHTGRTGGVSVGIAIPDKRGDQRITARPAHRFAQRFRIGLADRQGIRADQRREFVHHAQIGQKLPRQCLGLVGADCDSVTGLSQRLDRLHGTGIQLCVH